MLSLVLAACFFVGIHLFVSGTTLRDRLVAAVGANAYLGLFSLGSLGGMIWLCMAYAALPAAAPLFVLPGGRWIALLLVADAFLLAAIGLTTASPTATGGEAALERDDAATGILRVSRHPFLIGVGLWAFAHLLVNADPPGIVFFGALAVLSAAGPASIDRKRARLYGEAWQRFANATSIVPFAAIASGRNRLALGEIGAWRWALGVALFAGFLAAHAWLFGANPLPVV